MIIGSPKKELSKKKHRYPTKVNVSCYILLALETRSIAAAMDMDPLWRLEAALGLPGALGSLVLVEDFALAFAEAFVFAFAFALATPPCCFAALAMASALVRAFLRGGSVTVWSSLLSVSGPCVSEKKQATGGVECLLD